MCVLLDLELGPLDICAQVKTPGTQLRTTQASWWSDLFGLQLAATAMTCKVSCPVFPMPTCRHLPYLVPPMEFWSL